MEKKKDRRKIMKKIVNSRMKMIKRQQTEKKIQKQKKDKSCK